MINIILMMMKIIILLLNLLHNQQKKFDITKKMNEIKFDISNYADANAPFIILLLLN